MYVFCKCFLANNDHSPFLTHLKEGKQYYPALSIQNLYYENSDILPNKHRDQVLSTNQRAVFEKIASDWSREWRARRDIKWYPPKQTWYLAEIKRKSAKRVSSMSQENVFIRHRWKYFSFVPLLNVCCEVLLKVISRQRGHNSTHNNLTSPRHVPTWSNLTSKCKQKDTMVTNFLQGWIKQILGAVKLDDHYFFVSPNYIPARPTASPGY